MICVFFSQFYEPDALLSDPADGRIFIELLGKYMSLDRCYRADASLVWPDTLVRQLCFMYNSFETNNFSLSTVKMYRKLHDIKDET